MLEPEVQSYISNVGIHCVVIAACAYNMDVDKSWIFSTSLPSLQSLGQICSNPKGTHQSVIGTKHPDGSLKSRDTAQYPKTLCEAFAKIVHHLFSKHLLDLTCAQFMPLLSSKTPHEPPFSCEDGGGIPSQPDWSRAGRCHQDVFKGLRSEIFSLILNRKLHLKSLAHVEANNPNAPFNADAMKFVSTLISDFLQAKNLEVNWFCREHQPMFLEVMKNLSVVMLAADVNLLDCLLLQGVSTGFQNGIPPSNCFGPDDRPILPETPLPVHLANWPSGDVTCNLVQEEINQGWVFKFEGGLDEAREFFPAVAVGRLGVAFSDSRLPRLVVDSSSSKIILRILI